MVFQNTPTKTSEIETVVMNSKVFIQTLEGCEDKGRENLQNVQVFD